MSVKVILVGVKKNFFFEVMISLRLDKIYVTSYGAEKLDEVGENAEK